MGSHMAKGRNLYDLAPGEGHILQAFQEKSPRSISRTRSQTATKQVKSEC